MTALRAIIIVVAALMMPAVTTPQSGQLNISLFLPPENVRIDRRPGGDVISILAADGPRYAMLEQEGLPALPYRIVTVLLPQGHRVSDFRVSVIERTTLTQHVAPIAAPAMVTDAGRRGSSTAGVSAVAGVFPVEVVRFLGTGSLHGYRLANFAVYPLRTNGTKLELASELRLSVSTAPDPAVVVARQRFRKGFRASVERRIEARVANPRETSLYGFSETVVSDGPGGFQPTSLPSLEGSPVDYVIVTVDSLAAVFQTLADFKTDKGIRTVVRTTEWILANYRNGSDPQETIRNFIIDAYEKWGISYVLLGGDTDVVPARLAWSAFYDGGRLLPVDLYFGGLDGDWNADHDNLFGEGGMVDNPDLYAEVYVGRLPAVDVASATTLTEKIIRYETPNDPDYTHRVLLLAEVLFPPSWMEGDTITLNGADLAEVLYLSTMTGPGLDVVRKYQTPIDTLYPGSIQESRACAIDSINAGFNLVSHLGHGFRFNMSVGDRSLVNADADAFTNADRLSNFFLLNCTAVAYTYFCLAEHMLLNPNGGAVSAIGANESAFPLNSWHYMHEYYDLVLNRHVVRLGEAFARSRLARTPLAASGDNDDLWTHYIYTCLGDPEMPQWNNVVDSLGVSHVASVGLGTTAITVTVTASGGPVDSSFVCLSKAGEDYVVGSTDGAGQMTLDFRTESAGVIKVVTTGRNHARHESFITVSSTGVAYVKLAGYTVDDDSVGGTVGNGDGFLDAGETVDLSLSVENTGSLSSGSVDLIVRSSHGLITIIDSTAFVGTVNPSQTVMAADSIRVILSSSLGDEEPLNFEIAVREDSVDMWYDDLNEQSHAPELSLVTLRINDTASGNGDGIVDAGEEFRLYYRLKNFGTGEAPPASATIRDLDGAFVFTDSIDAYAALGSLQEAENAGGFLLRESDVSTGHRLEIKVTDAFSRAYLDTFELRAPAAPSGVVINPALGIDRLELSWNASASADVHAYVVYRSQVPGGPYTIATADPVVHTLFLDVGLSASTTYYYVVTAVDSSGNESGSSAEKGGSTNPAQVEGWPIAMADETVSSPVLGDIDGDGDIEIVQGGNYMYAWHHDGDELIDGDADPQTWGVLSTAGLDFVSHTALGRIDGQPGLDIVAASRTTKEVYVFDYTGTPVTGWPRPVENTIRAGVAVGDLDGDGRLEIVACDERGVLYAWNADGSELIDGDMNPGTPGVLYRLPGCSFQYSGPAVVDIDGDGKDEVIIGTQGDSLYVINDDASVSPGWPYPLGSDVSGSVAVGDLDNDGDLEIVTNTFSGFVCALHHDGSLLWTRWFSNNVFFAPSPAVGDVTGDGFLETFVPSSDRSLYAVTHTGATLSGWPVPFSTTTTTESSPIIVDINGDGSPDIVLGDEAGMIHGWDAGGNLLDGFPLAMTDAARAVPAAGDVDGDGDIEIVAAGWDKSVYVWDFDGVYDPSKAPWPGYHANVHNSGYAESFIPTGITGASFSFRITAGVPELAWWMPDEMGSRFHIARATSRDGEAGKFAVIAYNVTRESDGTVIYLDRGAQPGDRYVYRIESADDEALFFMTAPLYVPVTRAALAQNYPNPFNPVTTIEYLVPDGPAQTVALVVYSVRGERVRALVAGPVPGGRHQVEWDGRNDSGRFVSSGIYFYRLALSGFSATRKMLLMK